MSEPVIIIRLEDDATTFQPGDALRGQYQVVGVHPCQVTGLEVSVLWHTEGKGDEDMAVHEFWRQSADEGDVIDFSRPGRFATTLPASPLSYEGRLLTLRWCVRVRVFLHRNRELVDERVFRLGNVPAIKIPEPTAESPEPKGEEQ